jgi:uncharacterized protein (DUF362 family)
MIHHKLESKVAGINRIFRNHRISKRILPLVLGLVALFWFLIRVIPKPQRATYPCMKVAYPLMSGLVIWLSGITGMSAAAKLLLRNIRSKKYLLAFGALLMLSVVSIMFFAYHSGTLFASDDKKLPVHIPNEPFGVAQGIMPGRVVWAWDPAATNENCTNDVAKGDGYFLAKNNNQQVIDKMIAEVILKVAGKKNQKQAWDDIFKYFNKKKGKGDRGYKNGETVFIKINQGCASWNTDSDLSRRKGALGYSETSPQVVLAVIKQLVKEAGVPQDKIIVADPLAHIYNDNYALLHNEFPDVLYGDKSNAGPVYGRTILTPETIPVIFYSDKGTVLKAKTECLYTAMQNADYMINIAALKAHGAAGITLLAKNHFGSITTPSAGHLHPGLVGEKNDQPYRIDYGMYRVQVDLMGSKYLGRNTMLNIVDGLWGGVEAIQTPVKWKMQPFNNDWPSSIFVSQDQVALESVCFDFLRYEATVGVPEWKNRPNMAQGVDDYMHQAASSKYWPEGIIYDPDNSGTPIPSLGVHEHWDNAVSKNYSRNLGKKDGIELIKVLASGN